MCVLLVLYGLIPEQSPAISMFQSFNIAMLQNGSMFAIQSNIFVYLYFQRHRLFEAAPIYTSTPSFIAS